MVPCPWPKRLLWLPLPTPSPGNAVPVSMKTQHGRDPQGMYRIYFTNLPPKVRLNCHSLRFSWNEWTTRRQDPGGNIAIRNKQRCTCCEPERTAVSIHDTWVIFHSHRAKRHKLAVLRSLALRFVAQSSSEAIGQGWCLV